MAIHAKTRSKIQYSTVQYSTAQYCTVLYSTVPVQYWTVLYSTVQYCSDRFRFRPVPVHAGSGSNRFPVNRTRFPVPGLIPKFHVVNHTKTNFFEPPQTSKTNFKINKLVLVPGCRLPRWVVGIPDRPPTLVAGPPPRLFRVLE